ncbi:hypothetical protein [Sporosalibacterium faouarense]|uniref:hypothetical protein n=1 Tax=Sporosalibacterium faouarense TaxID=516123 RepID=UPI00192A6FE5|nr:hypothetical protein [Sporosalibacterium faouarense]
MKEDKKNNDLLTKLNELLKDEKELMILKGQLQSPEKQIKEDGQIYYTFTLKTVKKYTNDLYSTGFSTYYIVIPTSVSAKLSDDDIKDMKGNEVLVLLDPSCRTKIITARESGNKYKVNHNINLYCIDIMKVRDVERTIDNSKVISL